LCAWTPAQAGVDDVLEAIKQSEFSFARSSSEVPFFPVAWAQDSYYPASTFTDVQGLRPAADVNGLERHLDLRACDESGCCEFSYQTG
jgi:hypothetical protein